MAPRGGRFRAVAPGGGGDVGKAPAGPQRLLQVALTRTTLQLLGLAEGLTPPGLSPAPQAHPRTRRPALQAGQPPLGEPLPVAPNRPGPRQDAHRRGHALFRRDAQAQGEVVGPRMILHQVAPALTTQRAQDHAARATAPSGEDLPALCREAVAS
jgi:hypothetical protein